MYQILNNWSQYIIFNLFLDHNIFTCSQGAALLELICPHGHLMVMIEKDLHHHYKRHPPSLLISEHLILDKGHHYNERKEILR
jgi:hypothetical protein